MFHYKTAQKCYDWAYETTQTRRFFPSYNNIKHYIVPNLTNPTIKRSIATFFYIFCSLIWVISTTFTSPLHLYCNPFYSNYYSLNREGILRKLPRTISQESTNIWMKEKWLKDESSDEDEDDGTNCKIHKILSIELTEKCGDWVQCDTYNEYIFPKCYDRRDISTDYDFFVVFSLDRKC